ncbi:MAG: hypothetical protein HQM14_10840 [SAR324 cluster bacterium]|nr:hypothetical protein [SAR324 cluster bacterium]
MLFRLIILIMLATCFTAMLWPIEPTYTYGIVIVLSIILNQFPQLQGFLTQQFMSSNRSKEQEGKNKIVDLEDFRRKKQKSERKDEFRTK